MLDLEIPGIKEDQRRFSRIEFRESVEYEVRDARHFGGCLSCDLSLGGMRINFEEFLPLHTLVNVRFRDQSGRWVDLVGKVMWISKLPHTDRYQMGLKFVEEDNLKVNPEERSGTYNTR